MILTNDINDMLTIINEASAKLSVIIGEPVELQICKPTVAKNNPAFEMVKRIDQEMLKISITQLVCNQYMISAGNLRSKNKLSEFVDARKTAAHLLSHYVDTITHEDIAVMLNIDRSTVSYSIKKANDLILTDKSFRFNYEQILDRLKSILNNG